MACPRSAFVGCAPLAASVLSLFASDTTNKIDFALEASKLTPTERAEEIEKLKAELADTGKLSAEGSSLRARQLAARQKKLEKKLKSIQIIQEKKWQHKEEWQAILVEIGYAKEYADELKSTLHHVKQIGCVGFAVPVFIDHSFSMFTCAAAELHRKASDTTEAGAAAPEKGDLLEATAVLRRYREMMSHALQLVEMEMQVRCSSEMIGLGKKTLARLPAPKQLPAPDVEEE